MLSLAPPLLASTPLSVCIGLVPDCGIFGVQTHNVLEMTTLIIPKQTVGVLTIVVASLSLLRSFVGWKSLFQEGTRAKIGSAKMRSCDL